MTKPLPLGTVKCSGRLAGKDKLEKVGRSGQRRGETRRRQVTAHYGKLTGCSGKFKGIHPSIGEIRKARSFIVHKGSLRVTYNRQRQENYHRFDELCGPCVEHRVSRLSHCATSNPPRSWVACPWLNSVSVAMHCIDARTVTCGRCARGRAVGARTTPSCLSDSFRIRLAALDIVLDFGNGFGSVQATLDTCCARIHPMGTLQVIGPGSKTLAMTTFMPNRFALRTGMGSSSAE